MKKLRRQLIALEQLKQWFVLPKPLGYCEARSVQGHQRFFFCGGGLPQEALAPKVALPESIHQLHPINCCNFLGKVIAKVVVHTLSSYMDDLISKNQSAFIGGRQIQDNLISAQEAFHALKQRDKGGKDSLPIKLDLSKAYDRLEWGFLKEALLAYGFHQEWVQMITKLVTSLSYRYKINGLTNSKIIPQRGLRQGDPLSPYLFILAVDDVLSSTLSKAQSQGLSKTLSWAEKISHKPTYFLQMTRCSLQRLRQRRCFKL